MATISEEVLDILGRLPAEQQRRVLDYARDLAAKDAPSPPTPRSVLPPGKPSKDFLAFRPMLTPEEVDEMARAIEEGCETIEPDDDNLSL